MIDGKGFIKVKGDSEENRKWVYDNYGLKYGKFYREDDLVDFPKYNKAAGSFYKAGYLYIPQDANTTQTTSQSTPTPTPAPKKGKGFG